jgi:hypothetical protein
VTKPFLKWNDTGLTAEKEPVILTDVLTDFNTAFGGDLNTTNLESPQGQLSTSLAVIIGELNDMMLNLVAQVDPRYAFGSMQDAVGEIYFLERKPALSTTVNLVCSGLVGAVIPIGSLAQDTSENIYISTADGTIDASGNVTIPFKNIVSGAIACPAASVTKIYQFVAGWESVTNPLDGAIGRPVESRIDFETRRSESTMVGSQGALDSAYAAIFNVSDVIDVYRQANLTASPLVVGSTSYSIPAGASYIAVQGGDQNAIAQAIYDKILCKLVGNTVVSVGNESGTQSTDITFERPASLPIKFAVNIKDSPLLPSNIIDLTKTAIVNTFNGTNGGDRARIGQTIYASQYYAPVSLIDASVKVISVKTGTTTPTLDSDQFPTISKTNITVTLI